MLLPALNFCATNGSLSSTSTLANEPVLAPIAQFRYGVHRAPMMKEAYP